MKCTLPLLRAIRASAMGMALACCLPLPDAAAEGRRLPAQEVAAFASDGPLVQRWLERAAAVDTTDAALAVRLYCRSAKYGSLEGLYRLGRMALAGRGMPRDPLLAATLFGIAAGNGHQGATSMVLITGQHEGPLPPCMRD